MAVFEAHRTLGLVCDSLPFALHREGSKFYLSFPVGRSFLTYEADSLKLRLLGVQLDLPSSSTAAFKDRVLVAVGARVLAWHKVRLVQTYEGSVSAIKELAVFGNYVLALNHSAQLLCWDADSGTLLQSLLLGSACTCIEHPPTYLNKVVVACKGPTLTLVNVSTGTRVFDYPHITAACTADVNVMRAAPALDVAGLGLADGRIVFVNLLTDSVLFDLLQDSPVTCMSFCTDNRHELIATGDDSGKVRLWDLPSKRLDSQIVAHESHPIDGLCFMPGEPVFVTSSGRHNSIKQWILEADGPIPRVLRQRSGFQDQPSSVRFYDDRHVLSCSSSSLRDFSLLNEAQNLELSSKHANKALKRGRIQFKLGDFHQIAFSCSRERDWSNILSCHLRQDVPFLWAYENKVLSDKPVIMKTENIQVTAVSVSACGNFGLAGLEDGSIEKFNMQSGLHILKLTPRHSSSVVSLASDAFNQCLVSASSQGELWFWDFFSGKLKTKLSFDGCKALRLQPLSNLLAVSSDDAVSVVDIRTYVVVRSFPGTAVDLSFSADSRWLAGCDELCVKVWDIPSARLVEWMQFDKQPVSLDFSPNGEFLATAHEGSNCVFLWLNKATYQTTVIEREPDRPRTLQGFDVASEDRFYTKKRLNLTELTQGAQGAKTRVDIDRLPELPTVEGLTLSDLPFQRIIALHYIDDVKDRNKPINPPKKPDKVPFFLPDTLGIVKAPVEAAEESHVVPLQEVESELSKRVDLPLSEVLAYLKGQSPSALELSLLQVQEDEVEAVAEFFIKARASDQEFDFIESLVSCFLKHHGNSLSTRALQQLELRSQSGWRRLEGDFLEVLGGLDRLLAS
jgi:U3 small nucleolar RNA-associated protein 21